ncbi:MAG: glycosyltransferase family 9 protein, partial [Roseiflexaceae bacterium]
MRRFLRLLFLRLLPILAHPLVYRQPAAISAVLYIKPDHLGDLLLATPVLAALRQRLPNARVTALVGPWSRMVLQRNPDVDLLLTCPFPGFERRPLDDGRRTKDEGRAILHVLSSFVFRLSSLVKPYVTLIHYALLLRAGRYDLAIIGRDDHWWGAALALLAGVPYRVGFAVPECRPFLTTALPWNPRDHVTDQGLELIQAIFQASKPIATVTTPAVLNSQFRSRFDSSQDDITWANEWIAAQNFADLPLVLLHPGTGGPAKLWFAERWAAVADALQALGARVVLTGGPDELA